MTVKNAPPKKLIKVNGIMKLNPEYEKWKANNPSDAAAAEENAATDASGVPMVAATFAPSDDNRLQASPPPGYQVPIASSTNHPAAGNDMTSSTPAAAYDVAPPQQQQQHQSSNVNYPPPAYGRPPEFRNDKLGRVSAQLLCPNCHRQTTTLARETIGTGTIIAVIILLILFWPLFWLPLVMPDCKQIDHYCRLCNAKVGESPSSCCNC